MIDLMLRTQDGKKACIACKNWDEVGAVLDLYKGKYKSALATERRKGRKKPVRQDAFADDGFTIVPVQTVESVNLTAKNGFQKQEVHL